MKYGTLITLHKGGKTNPNNYRTITLTSVILKLFETVIVERSKHMVSYIKVIVSYWPPSIQTLTTDASYMTVKLGKKTMFLHLRL